MRMTEEAYISRKHNEKTAESILSLTKTMYEFTQTLERFVDNLDKAGMLEKGECK